MHVIFVKIANISELKISGNTFDIFLGWLLCVRNYADLTNLTRDFNNKFSYFDLVHTLCIWPML